MIEQEAIQSHNLFPVIRSAILNAYGDEKLDGVELSDGTRIYHDLHLDEPVGRLAALDCMYEAARAFGISERKFVQNLGVKTEGNPARPSESHDYTLREIVDAFEGAINQS